MKRIAVIILLLTISLPASARYIASHQLADGRVAVVAEGDLEPRSIGSYSVRLYGARNSSFPTDDFLGGLIRRRNGTIEKVVMADIDEDGTPELVVVIRNAGTGSYLSADAFNCTGDEPVTLASVEDLAKDADVVDALRTQVDPTKERDRADERGMRRR